MRPADEHLNPQEFELLLFAAADSGDSQAGDTAIWRDQQHLDTCAVCQDKADKYRNAEAALKRLEPGNTMPLLRGNEAKRGPECATEQTWLLLAAGLIKGSAATHYLEHASGCDWCGTLLKESMEDLAQDGTSEEQEAIAKLPTLSKNWQRKMASELAGLTGATSGVKAKGQSQEGKRAWRLGWWPKLAFAVGGLAIIALSWTFWQRQRESNVSHLLIQAYAEQRIISTRIQGAPYAPLSARTRGPAGSNLEEPASLHRAEAILIDNLPRHREDIRWLHLKGQAALLKGNYATSISTLEKAKLIVPEDTEIITDLASAYILRAEILSLKDPLSGQKDYSTAADFLRGITVAHPLDQVAAFNLAVAYQRLFLFTQAEEEWERYLKLDSSSPWATEARTHLDEVRKELQKKKERSQHLLLTPAELFSALAGGENARAEIAAQAERYLQLAIEDWLPQLYSADPDVAQKKTDLRHAVEALAQSLADDHKDYWLRDFIAEADRAQNVHNGVFFLANAVKKDKGTDLDSVRSIALKAAHEFSKRESPAGEMRSLFEVIYVDQLSHATVICSSKARDLAAEERIRFYAWLHVQVLLESAACASMNDESGRILAKQALKLAREHNYHGLELRALNFLAVLCQIMGDEVAAWQYAGEGLQSYWSGSYPPMSGYSLYAGLDHVAEENHQRFLDVALLQEATGIIADDPDKLLRAMEQTRLAQALLRAGDPDLSEVNFEAAQKLFLDSAEGERKKNFLAEAQIGLAAVELIRAQPEKAIARLEKMRSQIAQMQDKDIQFDFFRSAGLAHLKNHDREQAEKDLRSALVLTEDSLIHNASERERLIWSQKTESTYRGMAELVLQEDPDRAFLFWEWYKASSLRSAAKSSAMPLPLDASIRATRLSYPENRDKAVVSYVLFPDRMAIWVYDAGGTKLYWVAVSQPEIELQARTFSEYCSDRRFSIPELKREGFKLYQRILLPVEELLRRRKHLSIETDGSLGVIPFEALVDSEGNYVGDRWQVSYSSGIHYLAAARSWAGISPQNRALIVAVPSVPGWEPIPEAVQEAGAVSSFFSHPQVLLEEEPVPERVLSGLSRAEIFHFAGHAMASENGVGLVLGESHLLNVGALDDAAFHRSSLVVLSACTSANGTTGVFADRDSLARQLVSKGVPEVVASRWLVNSKATALLMTVFYTELSRKLTVAEALQKAALSLRTQQEFSHPFYWAGFSVFGKG